MMNDQGNKGNSTAFAATNAMLYAYDLKVLGTHGPVTVPPKAKQHIAAMNERAPLTLKQRRKKLEAIKRKKRKVDG